MGGGGCKSIYQKSYNFCVKTNLCLGSKMQSKPYFSDARGLYSLLLEEKPPFEIHVTTKYKAYIHGTGCMCQVVLH